MRGYITNIEKFSKKNSNFREVLYTAKYNQLEVMSHNIFNTSETDNVKLYTIYSPPKHRNVVMHATKELAIADEEEHFDGKTTQEL